MILLILLNEASKTSKSHHLRQAWFMKKMHAIGDVKDYYGTTKSIKDIIEEVDNDAEPYFDNDNYNQYTSSHRDFIWFNNDIWYTKYLYLYLYIHTNKQTFTYIYKQTFVENYFIF